MANSTSNVDAISASQSSKEVTANNFFDAASQAITYGRRGATSSGLTWGYYGGNVRISAGTMALIANGTLTLTGSTTNYIVAAKTNGAVSVSTTTTNWDDSTNYWRLYSVVAGSATVTSWTDARLMAQFTQDPGSGGGPANTDALPEGSTNLYFTTARVRSTVLSGYVVGANTAVSNADTVEDAIEKLQGQITYNAPTDAKWPAFSAYLNSAQAITSSTWTKIQLGSEEFDTAGAYDSTTNYRFQPLVPGYYQVTGAFVVTAAATSSFKNISIYKNGAGFKYGTGVTTIGTFDAGVVTALIFFNGSTDYVELWAYIGGATPQVQAGAPFTYFQAHLLRRT